MYTEEEQKQDIILWLLHNQADVKELIKPIIEARDNIMTYSPEFNVEIKSEFKDLVTRIISVEIGKHLAVSPEIATIVVQDLNVEEYLQ